MHGISDAVYRRSHMASRIARVLNFPPEGATEAFRLVVGCDSISWSLLVCGWSSVGLFMDRFGGMCAV